MKKLVLPLLALSLVGLQAFDNHQVGFKYGLTSIDNDDGWNFKKSTFFTDLTLDTHSVVKPRLDLGYLSIDEKDKGSVDSALQFALNGIYDFDLSGYTTAPLTPYLLGGLGYEYVFDEVPSFESHFYGQVGAGARYRLNEKVALVSEFKALQMFGGDNEDNEFALMFGFDVPLFIPVEVDEVRVNTPSVLPQPNLQVATPTIKEQRSYQNDDDGDGVDNSIDKCLHTPAGDRVDERGCTIVSSVIIPDVSVEKTPVVDTSSVLKVTPPKVKVKKSVKRKNLNIHFEPNSSIILTSSKSRVRSFADYLKANPGLKVTIEGYTDNSGSRVKNLALSSKRAKEVKDLLVKYGVKGSRIVAVGKGDLNPIADNETAEGRAKNRRIEAVVH